MGTTVLRGLSCRAARHGYRPPGEPRVSRARRLHDHRAQAPSLPRYPRGHRLAHHDDQRPGSARLGSGRHRGRGRAAGAARVDAHSAGRGGPPHRKAGRGRDGHGPGAHRHRDAPEEGSRRQVRRVLRSRDPDAAPGGPGDDRQHGSRVWRHRRDLPGGPGDASLPRVHRKEQGLFHSPDAPEPVYSDTLVLDLATVEASLAGPRRPQDRVPLRSVKQNFLTQLPTLVKPTSPIGPPSDVRNHWEAEGGQPFGGGTAVAAPPHPTHVDLNVDGVDCKLQHGSVVIAAITSCTNTSNPSVMIAAGIVAKNAVERGLKTQPWVKTSLAPGSKVVTDYLQQAGLMRHLEQLRFHLVGYGCTTCIGNSGPLPEAVSAAVAEGELVVCAVLSGNRNFEGRIQQEVRA